ncbi:hypothetical protein PSTT_01295 [Puccinia striiformis]|uniref:Secreted protein n=1 Tax=Puccinia striiformis TaxID=27350 RepID=A0A2S4W3V4_9BASI|nr:hypothetical protein PSTT_01295 [Puccinia striiformis]
MSFQKILLVALLAVSAVVGRSLVNLNAGEGKFFTAGVRQLLEMPTTDRLRRGSHCLNIITSVLKTPVNGIKTNHDQQRSKIGGVAQHSVTKTVRESISRCTGGWNLGTLEIYTPMSTPFS